MTQLLGRADVLEEGGEIALAGRGLDSGGGHADAYALAVLAYQAPLRADTRAITGYDLLDRGVDSGLLLRVEVAEELAPGEFGPRVPRQLTEAVVRG